MNKHLDEHRATLDRNNPRDFMDMMLCAHEEGLIEQEHMPMVFWDFIAAGTDTTAPTIVWLVMFLVRTVAVMFVVASDAFFVVVLLVVVLLLSGGMRMGSSPSVVVDCSVWCLLFAFDSGQQRGSAGEAPR